MSRRTIKDCLTDFEKAGWIVSNVGLYEAKLYYPARKLAIIYNRNNNRFNIKCYAMTSTKFIIKDIKIAATQDFIEQLDDWREQNATECDY